MRGTVTTRQLKLLLDFMEQHRELALGRVRGKEGNAATQRLWRKLSIILNAAEPNGSDRTPLAWRTYFKQYKSRVRNKYHSSKQGVNSDKINITPLEQKLIAIVGESTLTQPARDSSIFTYDDADNGVVTDGEENGIFEQKIKKDLDSDEEEEVPQEQSEESDANEQTENTERPAKRRRRNDHSPSPQDIILLYHRFTKSVTKEKKWQKKSLSIYSNFSKHRVQDVGQRLACIEMARLEVEKEQLIAINRQADATNRQAAALERLAALISRAVDVYAASALRSNADTSSDSRAYRD
ncbi:unnamed protein product [Plutella xylostella]|uniref:(diamondback moth) hypothetical protein n=1 Tax=Plutella xylostella TaxID=51655 RepID=A0A8S4DMK5_PLUXY|nr:unnamed protein product [Plutella xylostella]